MLHVTLGFLGLSTTERTKENKNWYSKSMFFKQCHENELRPSYKICANQTRRMIFFNILIHGLDACKKTLTTQFRDKTGSGETLKYAGPLQ